LRSRCTTPSACAESAQDLDRVLAGGGDGELAFALLDVRERLALEQLHDEIRDAIGRALDVGHLHDVRALDLSGDARLLQEAIDEAGLPREIPMKDLDRYVRAEIDVLGFVHRAHASVAEQAEELVLSTDDLADLDH
jgi:hypothetical protein